MKNSRRKWKSLTLKVEHLRIEIEDREETMVDLERKFMEELSELAEMNPDPPPPPAPPAAQVEVLDGTESRPPEEVESTPAGGEMPEEIRKLWKSIAGATHPDRTGNDERKTQLYKEAMEAWKSGAVDEIVRIATELGFELPEASPTAIAKLETIATDLEKKLASSEQNVLWQWGKAPPAMKAKIMEAFIASKKMRRKKTT